MEQLSNCTIYGYYSRVGLVPPKIDTLFCVTKQKVGGLGIEGSSVQDRYLTAPQFVVQGQQPTATSLIFTPPRSPRPRHQKKFRFPANAAPVNAAAATAAQSSRFRYVPPSPLQLWKIGKKDRADSSSCQVKVVTSDQLKAETGGIEIHQALQVSWCYLSQPQL